MAGNSTVENPSAADEIIKLVKQLQIARPVVQMYKENWEIPEILQLKGPDAIDNFCFLRKKLSSFPWYKCARWIFFPPNFVKHYQTSQAPSSCFGAGQIFVRCENRTDFTICTAWSKEKVFKCAHDYQIENLAETNFVEIFGRVKQILSVQCVRTHIW